MVAEVWLEKVQMYYSVWLQLRLDVTEFTKERRGDYSCYVSCSGGRH